MAWESTVTILNRQGQQITMTVTTEGASLDEIVAAVTNLGHLPTSVVAASSKKVAQSIRKAAKGVAPKRTGALRKGIVVSKRKERTKKRGKAVWDVWMDSGMNDVFQKPSPGLRGGYAYVPASMDSGFRTRNGGRFVGYGFFESAAEAFADVQEELTMSEVSKRLDKLWEKKQKEAGGD